VSRIDSDKQLLLNPLTNHWRWGKCVEYGHRFGQFNRVEVKERSEQVFDRQTDYRWALEDSFRYQNTMSNGTTQERVDMMLELWETAQIRQHQFEINLRQGKQLQLQTEQAKERVLA
jgi:hypothetical protein